MSRVGSRWTDEVLEKLRAEGGAIIPVSAYPRRCIPEPVMQRILEACRHGGHAPARGLPELRERLAAALRAETGVSLDPQRELFITQGAMHALSLTFTATLRRGDEVVTFCPCYFFHGLVELRGARMVHVPLRQEDAFAFDIDRLEAALTPRTRAILLNTPVNPTGHVAGRDHLQRLAELARRRGLLLVCDESYDKLVYDGRRHESILNWFEPQGGVVLVRGFTKSYALADWRVGYVAAAAPLIDQIAKVFEWEMLFGGYLSQKVAAIVLASGAPWLADVQAEFARNRDILMQAIAPLERFSAVRPQGNPFLFINISSFEVSDEAAGRRLLGYGLPNTPGSAHMAPGYLRVPFGGPEQALRQAGQALQQLYRDLENGEVQ